MNDVLLMGYNLLKSIYNNILYFIIEVKITLGIVIAIYLLGQR